MRPLLPLLALASVLMAAATVAWLVSHGRRCPDMSGAEYRRLLESDEDVQPAEPRPVNATRWQVTGAGHDSWTIVGRG